MQRTETTASEVTLAEDEEHPNPLGQQTAPGFAGDKEADLPQLSWFMTVFIIVVVSVVRGMHASHPRLRFNWLALTAGRRHCRRTCGDGKRDHR